MTSEGDRVRAAVQGDEDALIVLLEEHGPALRTRIDRSIATKWKSLLDADDVLQVTYLEVFLRIGDFVDSGGEGAFPAWLRRVADNNLRDAVKELGRRKRPQPDQRVELVDRGESAVALLEELGCTTTTPSRHAARGEAQVALDGILERLPRDYAEVVRSVDLEGRPVPEIAARLERSEGAVYMLRARAHDRMRELLGPASRYFTQGS